MAYINYQNLPSTSTPLNATNLNAMQETVEIVTNANGTYEKYDDGRLIQYAVVEAPASTGYATVTFPMDFYDTNYEMLANHRYTGGSGYGGTSQLRNITSPQPNTKSTAYIYSYLPDGTVFNYPRRIYYRAYGKWK